MNKYILKLTFPFDKTIVCIHRKNIKNIHLKVFRDLKVVLSVPNEVTDEWITEFLISKSSWIEKQLQKYKQSSGYNNLIDIKSGTSTQLLGKDCRIIKKISEKSYVIEDEKNIIINENKMSNKHQKVLENWWREKAYKTYQNEMNELYDKIFKKYGIEEPSLCVRKMKTLWGSCTPSKNKITLNEYLLKANLRCIQYVILHELTHLIYPYHNNEFYTFLTIHMPDWIERKKQLDFEVVQGI